MGAVAARLATLANGHHEFTVVGKLQNLVVVRKIGGVVRFAIRIPLNPHKSIVIHEESMLIRWPLIPRAALASPTLNEIPRLVEFHDGRRGGCLILFGKPARATKDPYVALVVADNGRAKPHLPL